MNDKVKLGTKEGREARHDEMTATVKGIVDKEKTVQDAKSDKLRMLREARDAAAAPPEKKKPVRKGKR